MESPSPRLRKSLGQHHLRHPQLCRPVIDFLEPRRERVLEVGPGGGVLTRELLRAGATVMGVELDPAWALHLRASLPDPCLRLVVTDARSLEWRRLLPGTLVAGNLPYSIATHLVERLLREGTGVPRAAFLVQREVAERIVARPGARPYGSFSVLVEAFARARILARIKPGSFRPPPRVESAFVGLVRRDPPLPLPEMDPFLHTVRLAFSQRRKTLLNSLGRAWGRPEAARVLGVLGLSPRVRAESLPLETLLEIHRLRPRPRNGS